MKNDFYITEVKIESNAIIKAYEIGNRKYVTNKELVNYKHKLSEIILEKKYNIVYTFSLENEYRFDKEETVCLEGCRLLLPNINIKDFKLEHLYSLPKKEFEVFRDERLNDIFKKESKRQKYVVDNYLKSQEKVLVKK